MLTPSGRSGRLRALYAWASLTLLSGTLLAALRAAAVYVMDHQVRGLPPALSLERSAASLGRATPYALVLAGAATAAGLALLRTRAPAGSRVLPALRVVLAASVGAALALLVLSGAPFDDPYHVPDPASENGRFALVRLSGIAILFSLALAIACRALRTRAASLPLLACSALLAIALPAAFRARLSSSSSTRIVRETVRELLEGEPAWETLSSRSGHPPHARVLTPAVDPNVDGGDLPGLVMPPPCEVRIRIPSTDGRARLRASAGVDHSSMGRTDVPSGTRVRFEVQVGGESRATAEIPLDAPPGARGWRHLGGENSLDVEPGDEVVLRTSLSPVAGALDIVAGFGRLTLERTTRKPTTRAGPGAPDVVLIVVDTLRQDRLGCYGGPPGLTPAMDALAARGCLFERAYATSSWTLPSTVSILTGLEPEEHDVFLGGNYFLGASLDTLAEALERAGSRTAAFSGNSLVSPSRGFDQGFETFDAYREFRKSDLLVPGIVDWIGRHAGERFFLYLHLVDPHAPHFVGSPDLERAGGTPPDDFPQCAYLVYGPKVREGLGRGPNGEPHTDEVVPPAHQEWMRRCYDASVSVADRAVEAVMAALEAHGLAERTVVALTSDHGEELFDHGLLGHGQSLYEELVRVPLIVAGPGVPRGARRPDVVSNRHLSPTLARLAGARLAGSDATGSDLLDRESKAPETAFFATEHGWWNGPSEAVQVFGVQEGPWSLHWAPAGKPFGAQPPDDAGQGDLRLFDLAADPRQRANLAPREPARVAALKQRIQDHGRSVLAERAQRRPTSGNATEDLLRRLGYIGDDEESPGPRR